VRASALAVQRCRKLALLAAWSLATYSLPAHKEFRFLLPALQLLMPYCGLALARLFGSASSSRSGKDSGRVHPSRPWGRWGAALCILLQLPMAAYFLLYHQR
jgi:phosphatidylinositol glycan class B